MASKIVLEQVTKRYGRGTEGIVAVYEISFHIVAGEFCAVLGPSGCGKSTLIHLIAGFIPATSGRVVVNGAMVVKPGPDRVVVSQDYSLFPWKTIRANVEFGLKARGLPRHKQQQVAQYYLALMHLSDVTDHYPAELSGGMRQRVALARALAVESACLLLDEPLGALDLHMRYTLQDELVAIWQQMRQTIVLVTHDLEEAVYLADRIIIMGSCPGHVHTIIESPLGRPRLPDLRSTVAFQEFKREVASHLQQCKLA
jgi:NitT/TauT family transport system ATP-binding protein